jgi:outer membrane protein OmpA-like peptidoglycan-associated protein
MSRLSENSERIRKTLETRNLYTPNDVYKISVPKAVKGINKLLGFVQPFDSINVGNTFTGQLLGVTRTPLVEIGLQMLGKQFASQVKSLGTAEFVPQIDPVGALFGGSLFIKKEDWQITRKADQSLFGKILGEVTGAENLGDPPQSPLDLGGDITSEAANIEYFNNTGKGSQSALIRAIKRNRYQKSSEGWLSAVEGAEFTFKPLPPQIYFTDQNYNLNPYSEYTVFDIENINNRLNDEKLPFNGGEYGTQLYRESVGDTYSPANKEYPHLSEFDYGLDDNTSNKLIWGRDGATDGYVNEVNGTDAEKNEVPSRFNEDGIFRTITDGYDATINRFNSTGTGLLYQTKELLNSKGKFGNFDMTKKKFIQKNGETYFAGSPLTKNVDGETDRRRQHNIVDPYDRFVKAIRYNGNKIYGGNENSVIHDKVTPKIHPVRTSKGLDVKNMMFSIENLAARTYRSYDNDANVGDAYLDDIFGTRIPYCEAGDNGGRLMWFAPYDIKLHEQSIARRETTNFIGRSEPIYTYNYTERLATLSFKLIIDYPPQVKGMNQDDASSFFAFGDREIKEWSPTDPSELKKQIKETEEEIDRVTPPPVDPELQYRGKTPIPFFFPNDRPSTGSDKWGVDSAVQTAIGDKYEDGVKGNETQGDGRDDGLNSSFVADVAKLIEEDLKDIVAADRGKDVFITILGEATQLAGGTSEVKAAYNKALGLRRADALKKYIEDQYSTANDGKTMASAGIIIKTDSDGSENNIGVGTDSEASIPTSTAKGYRNAKASIVLEPNQIENPPANDELDEEYLKDLKEKLIELNVELAKAKKTKGNFGCDMNQYTINDGILKGFESFQTDVGKFQPVFHSQTPEDFHRRLTFLQQCVRQGNAIRAEDGVKNSVFGRQPVQILRLGDFYNTKIVIDNISFDYGEAPWDLNPEGMGMQFMYADITIQMKIIGGQSLRTPVSVLQNAVSFNYYANSTFYNKGIYTSATRVQDEQVKANNNIDTESKFNELLLRDGGNIGLDEPVIDKKGST